MTTLCAKPISEGHEAYSMFGVRQVNWQPSL